MELSFLSSDFVSFIVWFGRGGYMRRHVLKPDDLFCAAGSRKVDVSLGRFATAILRFWKPLTGSSEELEVSCETQNTS